MPIITANCTGCGRCVAACTQRRLSLETVGTRKRAVTSTAGSCTACGSCVAACLFTAIQIAESVAVAKIAAPSPAPVLPWQSGTSPLMLAPMQGLTNRALRGLFADWVHPDLLFTEFVRAKNVGGRPLSAVDRQEISAVDQGIPLVVQLIGPDQGALVAAAIAAQDMGAAHLNLNLGCPYGRMMSGLTGGGMLQAPELLVTLLPALRQAIRGSFSIKIRAGYADPAQLFSLLPLFADAGVDFLILHPRTVQQEYTGTADHSITARAVQQTRLPIIANGDINTATVGRQVLAETGAAGLMLGRGAIADPLLFARLRGTAPAEPDRHERGAMYQYYFGELLKRYDGLYCGEAQLLGKVKNVLRYIDDPEFKQPLKKLHKAVTLRLFSEQIAALTA